MDNFNVHRLPKSIGVTIGENGMAFKKGYSAIPRVKKKKKKKSRIYKEKKYTPPTVGGKNEQNN